MVAVIHDCIFPQILLEESDEDEQGNLKTGMQVLVPCECGETPVDHMEFLEARADELQQSLLAYEPFRFLYHWAPAVRRKQIIRYGLRPGMRPTASTGYVAPSVCFADSPSWAWVLSGEQRSTPVGWWDLWQTSLNRLTEPLVLGATDRPSGLHEVRTKHRVYKRDLWYVGSRAKGVR